MKFVKIPVEIEAIQFVGENANEILKFMGAPLRRGIAAGAAKKIIIHTFEGRMTANVGDWIVRGTTGEFYPCKPDIFAAIYKPAPCPDQPKKTFCFDFDGVIATYSGWRGFDILGEPIMETIKAIRTLKEKGHRIIIFTTRPATQTLTAWLKAYDVPHDGINTNAHNPPMTSHKPIFHVMIDDRAVRYHGQSADALLKEIESVANAAE